MGAARMHRAYMRGKIFSIMPLPLQQPVAPTPSSGVEPPPPDLVLRGQHRQRNPARALHRQRAPPACSSIHPLAHRPFM